MPKIRSTGRSGRRQSPFIVTLLVTSLVLTILLTWQALRTSEYHRATAEAVLRDYAALAADEFVRRTANEVGYSGYYPLVTALVRWAGQDPSLPSTDALAELLPARSQPAIDLVRQSFRIQDGVVLLSGDDPELDAWLRTIFATTGDDAAPGLAVRNDRIGHRLVSIAYSRLPGAPETVIGFEVDKAALAKRFQRSFDKAELLPQSLAQGEAAEGWIQIAAYELDDSVIFASREGYASPLSSESEFGDTFGGVLAGSKVVAFIAPLAASELVIGGLPRSRLPLLMGLMLLTVGLLVTAIFQLRRERVLTELRSEFVSRVSHELRTPLTQIRMFAETLLLNRVRDDGERRRALQIMDREARRLTHLVENILLFSRGERGGIRLVREAQPLGPLVRELVEEFEALAPDTTLDLIAEKEHTAKATAEVDEDALRQVLLNLLDNAVKYGPSGQRIAVELVTVGDVIRIHVDDEGPGIPDRQREQVWERFHRLSRDNESAAAGTGIGLAVVRELVQLHGGRTWIESSSLGGARFIVELPRAHEAA